MQAEQEEKIKTFKFQRYEPTGCIQRYSYMLIRPPRFLYNPDIIEPTRKYQDKFAHYVFNIPFPLSLYVPPTTRYVILYLHGNSSSRFEGYSQLAQLPAETGLACFDFNGSGNRKQERYISLGKKESKDVDIAVRFLQNNGYKVVVWGRSMGAVSALLSQQAKVLVVDSPFASLKDECKELAATQCPCVCLCFFHCLFPCFFWLIARDVQSKSGMHPSEMDIVSAVQKTRPERSIVFMAAQGDTMIHYSHTEKLFNVFKGNKKLFIVQGTHNSQRPKAVLQEIYAYINEQIESQDLRQKNISENIIINSKIRESQLMERPKNNRVSNRIHTQDSKSNQNLHETGVPIK